MKQIFDVIIVGAGVVGLTSALAMAQRGFNVALIEAYAFINEINVDCPRVYAINQASKTLFHDLNVWQKINESQKSPYREMLVWDTKTYAQIHFSSNMVQARLLGTILKESALKEALTAQIKQQNITCLSNTSVCGLEEKVDCIKVDTTRGILKANLLMLSDGANSICRKLLKVPITSWSYNQQAIVAFVSTEKSHNMKAYQAFNADGAVAFLPMPDANTCSIVWSVTNARAQQLLALSTKEFNQELNLAFGNKLGLVCVEGRLTQFPLVMRHVKQYTNKRWLLLGDAAHTIHPLAGLGLNAGLADVSTWLSCLTENKNQLNSTRALKKYQRQRKLALWKLIALMEGLKSLFLSPALPIMALRATGLLLCNNLAPLKRMLIEQAMG